MYRRVTVLFALLAVVFPLSVFAQEAPQPNPVPLETVAQMRVAHDGVQFRFDPALAESVAAATYTADEQLPGPGYTEFTFDGYMPGDYLDHAPLPRVTIFAIEDFGEYPTFIAQLDALSALLAERPDLNQYAVVDGDDPPVDALPFLPHFYAAQLFRAHPQYIQVAGISGIRYLTYFTQAANPVTEGEVFYTFQGITEDGQHYVAAILPLNTGVIPPESEAPTVDSDDFATAHAAYLQNVLGLVTAADVTTFTPTLSTLDALVQSITVNR